MNADKSQGARQGLLLAAVLLFALAVLPLLSSGCKPRANHRHEPPVPADTPAARFLKGLGLETRVVLIEFGAFDCVVSNQGLDQMMRLSRENIIPHLGFVRVEVGKDQKAVDAYYAAKSPGLPVYRDPDASLAKSLDVTVTPTFLLVDMFGRVRYRGKAPDEDKLSDWAEALLEQEDDAGPDVLLFGMEKTDLPALLAATKLPRLDGAVKPLREYMGPHGLLVVFVDTNCPFSGTAIGDMPSVAATLSRNGIPSVLVNLRDPRDVVLAFYKQHKTGATVLYDVSTATLENWKVESVPTVFFLDSQGNASYRGQAVWSDLAAAVEKTLALPAGSVKFQSAGTEFG